MNLQSLLTNAKVSWMNRASLPDFARRMGWIYSHKIPQAVVPRDWTIGFCYPWPLGSVKLHVRSNGGADAFIHSEVFESQNYRVPLSRAPTTILDLGANIGLSTVYFARVFPEARIACVEPIPDNLRVLQCNLVLNGIQATVFRAAVHPTDGTVRMALHNKDYEHQVVTNEKNISSKLLPVRAMSVTTVLRELGWDRIGLLKVDIEGHEKVLFSGNCEWLQCVDAMCIECHDGFDETDLARLAEQFGFVAPQRLFGSWFMRKNSS